MSYDKCIIYLEDKDKSMPLLIFHVSNNLAALQYILVSKSLHIFPTPCLVAMQSCQRKTELNPCDLKRKRGKLMASPSLPALYDG